MTKHILAAAILCGFVLLGCKQNKKNTTPKITKSSTPIIIASNYPLQFFTQEIAGDFAKVELLAPNNIDPAFWKPSTQDVVKMQEANLLVCNGAGYESWLSTASIPESIQLNTSVAFKESYIETNEEVAHSHGGKAEHVHKIDAFTVWLNFKLANKQAETIKNKLIALYPEQELVFNTNFKALSTKLTALDAEMNRVSKAIDGSKLLYSHPVYQYLEEAYNLKGTNLHWEPDTKISHDMWHNLEHTLNHHKKEWMIWENTPLESSINRLKKAGIQSIMFNPCGNTPASGDFISIMQENISQLEKIAKP